MRERSAMAKAASRRFAFVRLDIVRDIDDSRLCPDMHSRPHHLLRNTIKAARLDTNSFSRSAVPRDRLMHQPSATFGTKVAPRLAVRVRSRIHGDRAGKWSRYLERREDGGHAVGRGALVAAFAAVTYEELLWCWEGRGEFYLAALASPFHFR